MLFQLGGNKQLACAESKHTEGSVTGVFLFRIFPQGEVFLYFFCGILLCWGYPCRLCEFCYNSVFRTSNSKDRVLCEMTLGQTNFLSLYSRGENLVGEGRCWIPVGTSVSELTDGWETCANCVKPCGIFFFFFSDNVSWVLTTGITLKNQCKIPPNPLNCAQTSTCLGTILGLMSPVSLVGTPHLTLTLDPPCICLSQYMELE